MMLQSHTPALLSYESALKTAVEKGWQVASEGPSGAQLRQPKQMRLADKLCVAIGVPLLVLWGAGALLILVGVLDYVFFTKERTFFLSHTEPTLPPK